MRGRGAAPLLLLWLCACPPPPPQPPTLLGEAPRPSWFPAERCAPDLAPRSAARERCHKAWTVLVYMAADNDLEPYAYLDLYSMEAGYPTGGGASGPEADLLVALDDRGEGGVRRLQVLPDAGAYDAGLGAAAFQTRGQIALRSPVVETAPERRPGGVGADLQDFLAWGVRRYPALRYLVVLWGHGEGWTAGPRPGFGGVAFNDTQQTYLDIPALRRALQAVARADLGGRPFDLYAADACLMQTVEVTSELSPVARYLLGSTQVQDYVGLPYRELMEQLQRGAFAEPAEEAALRLARALPGLYRDSLDPASGRLGRLSPEARRTFTLSALSGQQLSGRLVPALAALGQALSAYQQEDPLQRAALQHLSQTGARFLGSMHDLGRLLGSLAELVARDAAAGRQTEAGRALGRAVAAAQEELGRAVISEAHGEDYDADPQRRFRGVSVWLPSSAREQQRRGGDFARSGFYQAAPPWAAWVRALYGE